MKIVVDELPRKPQDCPFSIFQENGIGDKWYGCERGSIACQVDKIGCPFFVGINQMKEGAE